MKSLDQMFFLYLDPIKGAFVEETFKQNDIKVHLWKGLDESMEMEAFLNDINPPLILVEAALYTASQEYLFKKFLNNPKLIIWGQADAPFQQLAQEVYPLEFLEKLTTFFKK